jgi:hypothetical protein
MIQNFLITLIEGTINRFPPYFILVLYGQLYYTNLIVGSFWCTCAYATSLLSFVYAVLVVIVETYNNA